MDPLVFEPYFRPQVWGGRQLAEVLGKSLPPDIAIGESWEISGHPQHVTRVAEGPHQGTSLTELWERAATDLCGPGIAQTERFPLLIKYLDCHELLSVQVHPTNALAAEILGDESGKTEAWVVLAVAPTGRIYAGLQPGTTREDIERHLDAGTVAECLHTFTPQAGDCLFIPAGTVHAVGGGVLMAEIQQTSDATFRLFDWNRLGSDGRPRALHRPESLRSIDWSAGPVQPVTGLPVRDLSPGNTGERLVRCPYFELNRMHLTAPQAHALPGLSIAMLIEGSATLRTGAGFERHCKLGDTLLIPASCSSAEWQPAPAATLLVTRVECPANGERALPRT